MSGSVLKSTISCLGCGVGNRVPIASRGKPRCAKCHTDLPWIADATTSDLGAIVSESSLPVLVDLWAPWCQPCLTIAPALQRLAETHAGSLRVLKVNVDKAPEVSARLGVKGIPTLVLYRGGDELSRQVGALSGEQITQWVDSALK